MSQYIPLKSNQVKAEVKILVLNAMEYIKQITDDDLLYSTGRYPQYFVITYKEKESKKEQIYVYV